MSSSIDERIVRLGFDNAKFESGAAKSMSTIDKLKEKLQFKGVEQGAEKLDRSLKAVDFSKMLSGIESVEKRFSAMGIAGMNVINKITDSVINAAKKLEQATIGQIQSGGWSRAMNLANAQFQIEGLGEDWNEMQKAISYGVKDTAYGLDAAATAASSLVASGVAYKESIDGANDSLMHTTLRAISGVAAMTNSSYEEISRIFTTVAGNGRLMGDQLLQLSSRGMNVAATLGKTLGKTEAEIREMVSKGSIDFETFSKAMDDAFGAHAKEANKTFTGALSNMKAALSRFGAVFATPIIDKTNTFFISITKRIDELKNKLNSVTVPRSIDELHEKLDKLNLTAAGFDVISKAIGEKTINLGEDFAAMWQSGVNAFSALVESIDLSWFDKIVEKVDTVTNKVKFFFDTLTDYLRDTADDDAKAVEDATKTLLVSAEEAEAAKRVIQGAYGSGLKRKKALLELFKDSEDAEQHAANVQAYVDSVASAGWSYEKAAIKVSKANEKIAESEEEIAKKERLKHIFESLKISGNNLSKAFKNVAGTIIDIGKAIFKGFGFDVSSAGDILVKFTALLVRVSSKIRTVADRLLISISVGTHLLWETVKNVYKNTKTILKAILSAFTSVFSIDTKSLSNGIVGVTSYIKKLSDRLLIGESGAAKIEKISTNIFLLIKNGLALVRKFGSIIFGIIDSIINSNVASIVMDKISNIFDFLGNFDISKLTNNPITEFFKQIVDGIGELLASGSEMPSKLSSFINKILDALTNIDYGKILKIAAGIFLLTTIFRFIVGVNSIANALSEFSEIPKAIKNFFSDISTAFVSAGKAISKMGTAYSVMIIAKALALIAASIVALAIIDENSLYRAMAVIASIGFVILMLIKTSSKIGSNNSNLIKSAASFMDTIKTFYGIAAIILSISAAILIISLALAILEKTGAYTAKSMLIVVGLISAIILAVISLVYVASKLKTRSLLSIAPTLLAMSVMMVALSASMISISAALLIISRIPSDTLVGSSVAILLVLAGITAVIQVISRISTKQLLSGAVTIISISVAMSILAVSISGFLAALSLLPELNLQTTGTMMLAVTILFGGLIGILRNVDSIKPTAILSLGVLLLSLGSALLMISSAIKILENANVSLANAIIVLSLMGIIGLIFVAISKISSNGVASGGILSIGASFVLMSTGILLFVVALEKLSSISSGLSTSITILIAFAAVVSILGIAAAIFPSFSDGLFAVGEAFLYAGIGAILISGGILLAGEGFKKFVEALSEVIPNLDEFFTILEAHKVAAIALGVFIIAVLALIVVGIVKLVSVIEPIVNVIVEGITTVLDALSDFGSKLQSGVNSLGSTMSSKTKKVVISILGGIIGAIAAMTPEMLSTIGTLIIKILSWLGSIAGDIAKGLIEFLINLINGVADAIRLNSNRIMNAIANVFVAFYSLIIAMLRQIPGLGDLLGDWLDDAESAMDDWILKTRKAADDADKSRQDYAASMSKSSATTVSAFNSVGKATSSTSSNVLSSLTGMGDGISGLGSTITSFKDSAISDFSDVGDAANSMFDVSDIDSVGKNARTVTETEAQAAQDVIAGIYGNGAERIQKLTSEFGAESAKNIQSYVNDIVNNGWDASKSTIEVIADTNSELDTTNIKLKEILDTSVELSSIVKKNKQKNEVDEALSNGSTLADIVKNARGEIEGTTSAILDTNATLSDMVRKSRDLSDVEENFDNSGDAAYRFAESVTSAKKTTEKETTALGSSIDDSSKKSIRSVNLLSAAYRIHCSNINDSIDSVATTTTATYDTIVSGTTTVVASIESIGSTSETTATKTEISFGRIYDSISKLASGKSADTAGLNTMSGLISAIKNKTPDASAAMSSVATTMVNAYSRGMDQHSPSRVMYRLATNTVAGITNAVRDNSDIAANSMKELSDMMIVSFGAPLDYISKITSGELVYDPSIRPIVDTSNVGNTARSINSMFNDQTIQLSGYSGQLAADIGELDRSNAEVVAELRQLREDMSYMTEEIANMQMVMDTGALVGQISAPLDRSFGRKSTFKGRGN